jgi:hypothetical protein
LFKPFIRALGARKQAQTLKRDAYCIACQNDTSFVDEQNPSKSTLFSPPLVNSGEIIAVKEFVHILIKETP